MLSFIYNAVQRGEHIQKQSLLAYELMSMAPTKIIFMFILSFEEALVSSPIL